MKISLIELLVARDQYHYLLNQLGRKYLYGAPTIQRFLSPANWSHFPAMLPMDYNDRDTEWELSITGEQRYNMLFNDHARILLAVYIHKRNEGKLE